MLFPKLTFETVLQVEEKTRLDAGLSFVTDDEVITDVLIEPANAFGFISVYNAGDSDKWYLDWAYDLDGMQDVSVKIVAVSGDKTKTYMAGINSLSVEDDALLSTDNDLMPFEPDLLNYLPNGKNSFTYAHRKAQERILSYLDEQRIWHNDGTRYTKQELVDVTDPEFKDQFRQWSSFETLLIIFESLQVSVGDIFQEKKTEYVALRNSARTRGALQLDANKDGTIDEFKSDIISVRIKRR
tara:strand:- start:3033 stop:3755 length:723 start_codon:yes stop_codon:yes gene_type:complete